MAMVSMLPVLVVMIVMGLVTVVAIAMVMVVTAVVVMVVITMAMVGEIFRQLCLLMGMNHYTLLSDQVGDEPVNPACGHGRKFITVIDAGHLHIGDIGPLTP